jgi:anti-sigma factor RsiW
MTARSCDEIVGKLVDCADGELPDVESAEFAAHIACCDRCRGQLDGLRMSLAVAHAIWEDSEAALAGLRPGIGNDGQRRRAIWTGRRRVALVAAAAALLIAVGLLQRAGREQVEPTGPIAEVPTARDVEYQIARAAVASQLLTAADLLAEQPGGERYACERYRYVASAYPGTVAGLTSQSRLATLCDERVLP